MSDKVICVCTGVTEDQIIESYKAGNTTVEAIQEATEAGTVCGSCLSDIEEIIAAQQ